MDESCDEEGKETDDRRRNSLLLAASHNGNPSTKRSFPLRRPEFVSVSENRMGRGKESESSFLMEYSEEHDGFPEPENE